MADIRASISPTKRRGTLRQCSKVGARIDSLRACYARIYLVMCQRQAFDRKYLSQLTVLVSTNILRFIGGCACSAAAISLYNDLTTSSPEIEIRMMSLVVASSTTPCAIATLHSPSSSRSFSLFSFDLFQTSNGGCFSRWSAR